MTENESEKLYKDLRRKLADYGSAPPDAVWAGIRQQVPARREFRWKRSALLLLLLCLPVLMLTVGPRLWSHRTGLGHLSTTQTITSQAAPAAKLRQAVNQPATASQSDDDAAVAADASAKPTGLAAGQAPTNHAQPASSPSSVVATAHTRTRRVRADVVGHFDDAETQRRISRGSETVVATAKARRKRRGALALLAPTLQSGRNSVELRRRARTSREALDAASAQDEQLGSRHSTHTAKRSRSRFNRSTGSATGLEVAGDADTGLARRFSNERIPLLAVRPTLEEAEEPEVRRVKRVRPHRSRKAQLLKNWSIQIVAGPSLTYRTLGDSARQLERLERPSIGYSGQVTASYALTKQLTISTGLGYAEFANNLHYQLQKTSAETSRIIDFRDVYRFVSIPLLAQYTFGGNHRWRFGALGGANVGLLTGTRTTEGSACNCSQTTVPATGTYHNTSLVLTAGGSLNYQFAPGQWLTLRPQGQYFLNSLTDPASGRAARHPWSVGVQGGISFDLEPKK
ncbi:porin family protein [Hymenobacter wooponensis]|uniref:PorT family protein n=1 Tax=Hymenobacter wooponensis TaxID=1525360 RepID=A0A4Z0MSN2_9BACT|nr:porin family protein [Hymenobacter wooponensis]TGD82459.1 PorT family protein [Hymenobacter wooponensis]